MYRHIFLIVTVMLILTACSTQPQIQTVEVTKLVEVPVTIEVTRKVEVTRIVRQEVTRVVSDKPSITPTPVVFDPSNAFSMNYLGSVEQNGVTVELARVLFAHRDALKPDTNFDDLKLFDGHEYIGEIIWRITNNTDKNIEWWADEMNVRVNERQFKLRDFLVRTYFGESPDADIFPQSTIVGGVWFGIGSLAPNDIYSVSLLMGKAYESDSFDDITGNFVISADLSGDHAWFDYPDELK